MDYCLTGASNRALFHSFKTPTTQRSRRIAYVGDVTIDDLTSPRRAEKSLAVIKGKVTSLQSQVRYLRKALYRARERILYLESLKLDSLKKTDGASRVNVLVAEKKNLFARKKKSLVTELSQTDHKYARLVGDKASSAMEHLVAVDDSQVYHWDQH